VPRRPSLLAASHFSCADYAWRRFKPVEGIGRVRELPGRFSLTLILSSGHFGRRALGIGRRALLRLLVRRIGDHERTDCACRSAGLEEPATLRADRTAWQLCLESSVGHRQSLQHTVDHAAAATGPLSARSADAG
jgi:hypothetical protein